MPLKMIADLSEQEKQQLVADILDFFLWTEENQGRSVRKIKDDPRFADFDDAELAEQVRNMAASTLLWKRGEKSGTIYITSKVGEQMLKEYRKP